MTHHEVDPGGFQILSKCRVLLGCKGMDLKGRMRGPEIDTEMSLNDSSGK